MIVLKSFVLLLYVLSTVESAKILGIFHFPSKSHHILGSALLKALAKRGHEVTMLSSFPLKTPVKNYEDIELTGMFEFKEKMIDAAMEMQNMSTVQGMSVMRDMMDEVNDRILSNTAIKDLVASNRKFDVVIQCWFGNEAYLAIPHLLGAYSIVFSTIGGSFFTNVITGNSAPFSYVPSMFPAFPDDMNFFQRVGNTLSNLFMEVHYRLFMSKDQERLLQKYFPTAPPARELLSNVSLVLLNSHVSIESPRPYVPSMIQIGGFHVQEAKELKGDLKQFMDSATEGVIFFSLGSNFKSSRLPPHKLNAVISCFSKLPLKVLWKFETDDISNLPANVKIGKWLPQGDVLAHPNLKLFVTHGGLLSTTEAIHRGVPMVGIPLFGDQEANVDDGVNKGYLVKVNFKELTEEALSKAINEVLSNPKYRQTVQHRSQVLKDQPLKPLDNAVFWVEYVLRHKGAHHLKTGAVKLTWYQYYLLDVIAFLTGIALIVSTIIVLLLCGIYKLFKKCLGKKNTKKSKLA